MQSVLQFWSRVRHLAYPALLALGVASVALTILLVIMLTQDRQRHAEDAVPAETDHTATPISLFSNVSVYRRSGLFEIYGATLSERKTGPIEIAATLLRYDEDAPAFAAIWVPAAPLRTEASGLAVQFGDPRHAENAVFLVKTCGALGFTAFAAGEMAPAALAEPLGELRLRQEWQPWLDAVVFAPPRTQPAGQGWQMEATLGPGPHCIEALALVHLRQAEDTQAEVVFAGLTAPAQPGYVLEGRIEGKPFYEVDLELISADGSRVRVVPNDSGAFAVPELDPAVPISLQATYRGEAFAPPLGRWFSGAATMPVVIPVGRVPTDIRVKVNTDENVWPTMRRPSQVAAIYPPHAPMLYGGFAGVKEFHTRLFTNNYGYHDQDRIAENPNGCFRVFVAGSSTTEAIQVPVSTLFATLTEERLGLALGRCVEVISASTSNGDPGASFEHFMKYGRLFAPDLVLFEADPQLLLQMNDIYAWEYMGWSLDEPVKGRFLPLPGGGYEYRDRSGRWMSFLNPEPSKSGLPEGYDPLSIYFFDFAKLPSEFTVVFDLLDHIATQVTQNGPEGMRFGFFSVVRHLACRGDCPLYQVQIPEGPVQAGTEIWFREFAAECDRRGWNCMIPPVPEGYDRPGAFLSFDYDAHASSAGHQWIADQITNWVLQDRAESE